MFFWKSLVFHDPMDVGNLMSGSSAFSKSSLNIRKFMVNILLKPGLGNFEHYFASMWDECNCAVVWAFFANAWKWKVKVKSLSRVRLLVTPLDCSPPGSSVHGILQARALEWGAIAGLKTGQRIEFCSAVQQVHISSCFPYAWTSGSHNLMPEPIGIGLELLRKKSR